MSKWLLAAEADKIQDLIFRASKLKGVVGGSQLLSHFGDDKLAVRDDQQDSAMRQLLKQTTPKAHVITAGGGSFRIVFDEKKQAQVFGGKLAELYRLSTAGSLSVAQPVEFDEQNDSAYALASEKAEENLRQAKTQGKGQHITAHIPYIAFCASCGVALANTHQVTEAEYLCQTCLNKEGERRAHTLRNNFLAPFYEKVVGQPQANYKWPGKPNNQPNAKETDPTEELARYDSRNYVAYLVADGNSMGKIFSNCNQNEARKLSLNLAAVLQASLAEPTRALLDALKAEVKSESQTQDFIPVLPLILGGDDIFALIPAKWALDFARRFCLAYETEIDQLLDELKIKKPEPRPTMSAAVVVCKANYPYYLAHQVGEARLKDAKQLAKRLLLQDQSQAHSIVNFEVITGSQLVQSKIDSDSDSNSTIKTNLRPYWVTNKAPQAWGLPLQALIGQRQTLDAIPRRRRSQLRTYFDELSQCRNLPEAEEKREETLAPLLKRVARTDKDLENLQKALHVLGAGTAGELLTINRREDKEWHWHGLPDVLDAWDFLHQLPNNNEYREAAS